MTGGDPMSERERRVTFYMRIVLLGIVATSALAADALAEATGVYDEWRKWDREHGRCE